MLWSRCRRFQEVVAMHLRISLRGIIGSASWCCTTAAYLIKRAVDLRTANTATPRSIESLVAAYEMVLSLPSATVPLLIRVESTLCLNLKRIFSLPYEAVNHRVIICTYLGLCRYIQASSTPKKAIVSSTPYQPCLSANLAGWYVFAVQCCFYRVHLKRMYDGTYLL